VTGETEAPTIPVGEFARRRAAATESARERGLAGLLVCSRGGGTIDRHANVCYLANFYTPFPYIPDRRPEWSARGHAFLVLPVDAPPVLVIDVPPEEAMSREIEVVVAPDVVERVVGTMQARDLAKGDVGLVGTDTMPWSTFHQLEARLPAVRWSGADEILDALRTVKSATEIEILTRAAKIGSRAVDAMLDAARVGATYADVTLAGLGVLVPVGAILYNAFMSSGTGGDQPTMVRHHFPTYGVTAPLSRGQWFHVGLSGAYRGYYFDLARSAPIGDTSAEQVAAFEAAIGCVQAVIAAIRPGVTAGDLAAIGQRRLRELGYPGGGAFAGFGHGIGLGWESPWLVPGDATRLEAGMVLTVERTVRHRGYLGDFEETVLVSTDGPRILTTARVRRW
jgi:Xaa-Pro aminopeptidase